MPPAGDVPVLENVSGDAFRLTEVSEALIITGDGRELVITQLVDGITVPLRPQLWINAAGEPVMNLRDLVDSHEGWSLSGSAAEGRWQLNAAGYDVQLLLAGDTVRVTVDGRSVDVDASDVRYRSGMLFVTGDFLAETFGADVIFDADEHTLVLTIREKSLTEAVD